MNGCFCSECSRRQAELTYMRRVNPPDIQAELERDLRAPGVNCLACECRDCRLLRTVARDMQLRAQAQTRHAMILEAGVSVRPLPDRGRVIIYDEPRPVRFTRGRLLSPGCSVLVWGAYQLYSLIKSIVMGTAITSQDGHKILGSWFLYRGEPSRADGWRALAALSYVTITWLAVWAVIYSVLMVVF